MVDGMSTAARTVPALVTAVVLIALSGLAQAAPGDLDPSFDGDGMRTFGADAGDTAKAVLVQPDGKLVLAGYGDTNFAVARLNPDGISDLSFDGGMTGTDFGHFDFGNAAALQPDGKIVVAGHIEVGHDVAIARFNTDGSLDTSFDPGGTDGPGKKVFDYGGFDVANAVLVQPDGRIVVAGTGNGDFAITRLNPDGSFDPSFDGDGTAGADFGGADYAYAVALQPDDRIVVAGSARGEDVGVARFNPAGPADDTLDTSFGENGIKRFDYGGNEAAHAVLVQPDGRIVLVGDGGPDRKIAVTRLSPHGSFDENFGDGGTAWVGFGDLNFGWAAALQRDGKIVVAGERSGDEDDFAVARLQPGGALDTTFGGDGRTTVDFGGDDSGFSVALQADGRIVVAGDTTVGSDFAVARLEGDAPPAGGPGPAQGGRPGVPRCAGRRATIVGTARRDTLRGTRRSDVIVALGGNDRIRAGRGNDLVCGGAGNDNITGQSGRDRLIGGPGNDRLLGGGARDDCQGGKGRDRVDCERRRDPRRALSAFPRVLRG
jgi:uncharacterized delta-60 repeat protein